MKNKLFQISILITILFLPHLVLSQSGKTAPQSTGGYHNLNPDGNQSNVIPSQTLPEQTFSPEKKELLEQIQSARNLNDVERTNQLQSALNQIDGVISIQPPSDPRGHFILNDNSGSSNQTDYNITSVNGNSSWANATATVPVGAPSGGRIWVASTQYRGPNASDTIKFYYSDNNGSTWSYYGLIYFNFDMDYVNDELDIEAVYDGTSVWLYGVAGMYDYGDNRYKSMMFRFNSNGTGAYISILNYPGSASTVNQYYNPRICTDNTNYQASTFAYIICSQDSLVISTHHIKQQYVFLSNLFAASPTFNFKNPSGSAGFYWNYTGASNRIYLYGDIGYYYDAAATQNRIMTVYSDAAYGFNDMYLAWSNDYGSTIAGNLVLGETQPSTGSRIAFNGGQNKTGMLIYRTNYSASSDWDITFRNTTTGGTTAAAWNTGYIDFTSNIARSCDIIALRNANNIYKAAYSQMLGAIPYAYYSGFNGSTWSAPIQVSNVQTDTTWRKPRAGYNITGGDDCLTIWSPNASNSTNASRLCTSTVGIENTETPVHYSLSQNYPNPFNPSTNIKFGVPKTSGVKLVVYDITGKVAAELINKTLEPGNYNIDFEASKLSSGVYFYKLLVSGEYSEVKKMVLIK